MHTLLVCSPDNHLACTQMWLCLIRTEIIVLTLFSNILTYYIQINLTNQKKNELGILENDGSCGNTVLHLLNIHMKTQKVTTLQNPRTLDNI